ncbi:multi-component transcriptional regulator, winged helix family [Stanieria cyanosphaera PCC 7437]|uniref:Multi-component transcriptional regulator, winged helix family n=1 Tax=Stanieria cyanosphaera (strain ATCC 29371 / PCC 7437) TaxID=111780 RepID=K9XRS1_STAC7|nr:response regulator transcription factor [Stanieria cyanosphaera]AFZ35218.1 multi-component transcriptional regulator, winged helix family [Stanieria cyanosphaera PCC 7437]
MKILFIEDDEHTSELFSAMLSSHRYTVDVVADGMAGLDLATRSNYDLILLDLLIPTLNGLEVCRRLRAQGCQTPILMLTTKDANEDVIAGLDAGADDYVAKSCASSQLLARLRAILRRDQRYSSSPVLTWGLLCLDPTSARVTYDRKEISLRPKEYNLLELFLRHPQHILSRSAIIDRLWSIEKTPVEGSVTTLIKDLRHRLKSAGMEDDSIETVYGLGYRLKAAPKEDKRTRESEYVKRRSEEGAIAWEFDLPVDWDEDWQVREQRGRIAIEKITARFQISLEQRITALEAVERSFQTGDFTVQQQQAARTQAHKLAGGLGTFGYIKASEIARAIECLLETKISQETQLAKQFSQLLEELRQKLTKPLSDKLIAEPSLTRR